MGLFGKKKEQTEERVYEKSEELVLKEALETAAKEDENPFILGGAEIYKQALPFTDKLDVTFVHHQFDADVFFPKIDKKIWKETSREDFKADENNKYYFSFVTFERV